jgi:hypothetical protein
MQTARQWGIGTSLTTSQVIKLDDFVLEHEVKSNAIVPHIKNITYGDEVVLTVTGLTGGNVLLSDNEAGGIFSSSIVQLNADNLYEANV